MCMDMHTQTHINRIHSCKYIQKRKKSEDAKRF